MTIYEKLSAIQQELKVPKNRKNTFGNYNYRSAEDILEEVKRIAVLHKAVLFIKDEIVNIGDRYYIQATATLQDLEGEGKIEVKALAREQETKKGMDESQITGAASSYARKYALNGLFAIDDTKDADGLPPDEPKETNLLSDKQVKRLFAIGYSKGYDAKGVKDIILKKYKVTEIAKLTKKQYDEAVKGFESIEK